MESTQTPVEPPTPSYGVLRWLVLATSVVILDETITVNAVPRLVAEFEVAFVGGMRGAFAVSAVLALVTVVLPSRLPSWALCGGPVGEDRPVRDGRRSGEPAHDPADLSVATGGLRS